MNKGRNDNDSFLLFYLVILLAHFVIPFFAVQFFEQELIFSKNLPLKKYQYALAYVVSYMVLLLPELIYLLVYGTGLLTILHSLAYYGVAVCSLFLLTAVQYSDAMSREEYMKVGFGLFFVSIFALHIEAYLPWMGIELMIGLLLFWNGFYKYEGIEE